MESLVTKFDLPAPLLNGIGRQRVLDLLPAEPGPVTAIVAPAGFGKSSVLARWVAATRVSSAAVRLDEADQDPSRLGRHIADSIAIGLGEDLPSNVHAAMAAASTVHAASRVTPLLNHLASQNELVLALDDYHRASTPDVDEIIHYVIGNAPDNLKVCLTSRVQPDLGFKRLEASRRLTKLTATDLAFDVQEVAELLRLISGSCTTADAILVHAATEGWPVLVALLAHTAAANEQTVRQVLDRAGHELDEYVLEEILNGLDTPTTEFVKATSVLEQLSGPLADAVIEGSASGAQLDKLHRTGFPVEQSELLRGWYRYNPLVIETLRARLSDTATVAEIERLHRRAATWLRTAGLVESALPHAIAGRDHELAAQVIAKEWLARVNDGELTTVLRWLNLLPEEAVKRDGGLLLAMAWSSLMTGDVDRVWSFLESARELNETDFVLPGASSQAAGIFLIEALYFRIIGRLSDACTAADAALELEVNPGSAGKARALTYSGICRFWSGQFDNAARLLNQGAGIGERFGHHMARLLALGYIGLIEAERDSVDELAVVIAASEELMDHAGLGLHPTSAPALGASGLYQAALGNNADALAKLEQALTVADIQSEPGLLAYLNLACARVLDTDDQPEAAERRRRIARAQCRQSEDVGFIAARCGSPDRSWIDDPSVDLTAREISVLALLASSLPLRAIAAELFVSHNTIKTHVQSLYRKLGVSRREDAVRVGAALGIS